MRPLPITATVSAPSIVPIIVPRPPNRLVPPSTTAAITSSSKPPPALDEPLPSRAAMMMPAMRRGEAADRIDREGDPLGVDAGAAHRLGVGADAGDVAAESRLVEDDVAGDEDDDGDDGGHRNAEHPAAADLVERALRVDRNRIALGEQERGAADRAEARERDDEGGNALVGDEEALHEADDDAEQPASGRTTAGQGMPACSEIAASALTSASDRADGEIDARGGDDEGHRDRDDHQRRDLAQDVEEVRLRQECVGDQRKDDDHRRRRRPRC